jgi:tetratricopeptide (TPR) repeat protein
MARMRLAVGAAAAVIAAAALLLGGVFRGSTNAAATPPAVVSSQTEEEFGSGDTASLVRRLQAELRSTPSARGYALLGLAYQQRARETGDSAYYPKSEGVLRRALALAPRDALATSGLGSLALARHRFRDALVLGRRALALAPGSGRNYGVIGDALVELGRYNEAFRAFDTMARTKPNLAAYARVSYGRELLGDVPGAIRAMRLAVDAAVGQPEATAWAQVQLGKLYWSIGRLAAASRAHRAALAAFPGYVYALDALAQVEAAQGHRRQAIALEHHAVNAIPLPQFVAYLGDLYRTTRHVRLARRQYALVGVIRRLLVANGVRTDLETALFQVDHGIQPAQALALARSAQRERPSIDGDDVLAWALERNGRCTEARRYSQRALRLGTQEALKLFHRGMIERCLGRSGRSWFMRALELNPHFSLLWAPVAREALQ